MFFIVIEKWIYYLCSILFFLKLSDLLRVNFGNCVFNIMLKELWYILSFIVIIFFVYCYFLVVIFDFF